MSSIQSDERKASGDERPAIDSSAAGVEENAERAKRRKLTLDEVRPLAKQKGFELSRTMQNGAYRYSLTTPSSAEPIIFHKLGILAAWLNGQPDAG